MLMCHISLISEFYLVLLIVLAVLENIRSTRVQRVPYHESCSPEAKLIGSQTVKGF